MTASTLAGHRVHTVIDSPVGPLTLVAAGGRLTGLYMDRQRHRPPAWLLGEAAGDAGRADGPFTEAARQLREYFAGERTEFDVPLDLAGTPFQRHVWAELQKIPYGETVSYGQLADRIGQPTAARAVGLANGRNPVAIIVPCHRVIGSNGNLTGYGGGLDRKQHLLGFEHSNADEFAVMHEELDPGVRYTLDAAPPAAPAAPSAPAFDLYAGYVDLSATAGAVDWQADSGEGWDIKLSPYDTTKPSKGASSIAPFDLNLLAQKDAAGKQGAEFDSMGQALLGKSK